MQSDISDLEASPLNLSCAEFRQMVSFLREANADIRCHEFGDSFKPFHDPERTPAAPFNFTLLSALRGAIYIKDNNRRRSNIFAIFEWFCSALYESRLATDFQQVYFAAMERRVIEKNNEEFTVAATLPLTREWKGSLIRLIWKAKILRAKDSSDVFGWRLSLRINTRIAGASKAPNDPKAKSEELIDQGNFSDKIAYGTPLATEWRKVG